MCYVHSVRPTCGPARLGSACLIGRVYFSHKQLYMSRYINDNWDIYIIDYLNMFPMSIIELWCSMLRFRYLNLRPMRCYWKWKQHLWTQSISVLVPLPVACANSLLSQVCPSVLVPLPRTANWRVVDVRTQKTRLKHWRSHRTFALFCLNFSRICSFFRWSFSIILRGNTLTSCHQSSQNW